MSYPYEKPTYGNGSRVEGISLRVIRECSYLNKHYLKQRISKKKNWWRRRRKVSKEKSYNKWSWTNKKLPFKRKRDIKWNIGDNRIKNSKRKKKEEKDRGLIQHMKSFTQEILHLTLKKIFFSVMNSLRYKQYKERLDLKI